MKQRRAPAQDPILPTPDHDNGLWWWICVILPLFAGGAAVILAETAAPRLVFVPIEASSTQEEYAP